METTKRQKFIQLIQQEVVSTIGCTEPIAVALCVAHASEILPERPLSIHVKLSANILKNAMGVGIPGTNMIGLPIAIALGALIGKSTLGLEVLRNCTPEDVIAGKRMIAENRICIELENTLEKLYIEVYCKSENYESKAIIVGAHTHLVYLEKNKQILLDEKSRITEKKMDLGLDLNFKDLYEFATTAPLAELLFILETAQVNISAAHEALHGDYGHSLGKTLHDTSSDHILGNCTFQRILSFTSAACDARMAGAMIPVMSNSGSGNQGIAATIPVVIYAHDYHKSEEDLTRALILSHLTVIYIKESLGRLSALCGCVVAATGSSCGITYLMGGTYEQITSAVKNMIANLTGMICDGAKPSCALKVASGVSTAVLSAMMAIQNHTVTALEGIINDDVDKCIQNLTRIGTEGMIETDRVILDIMTNKSFT